MGDKDAFISPYFYGKIGREGTGLYKQNGYLWELISPRIQAKSLEWGRVVEILELLGAQRQKVNGDKKDKMIMLEQEGSLGASEDYESFPLGSSAYIIGAIPYFLEISKIREIIY